MKQTLIEAILQSCDWSTSANTCTVCVRKDLEAALKPIVASLKRIRHPVAIKVRKTLEGFYNPSITLKERVFTDKVSGTAIAIYDATAHLIGTSGARDAVYEGLKRRFGPVAKSLEKTTSPAAHLVAKKLYGLYTMNMRDFPAVHKDAKRSYERQLEPLPAEF
jgi:hypothetical protein